MLGYAQTVINYQSKHRQTALQIFHFAVSIITRTEMNLHEVDCIKSIVRMKVNKLTNDKISNLIAVFKFKSGGYQQ